MSSEQLCLAAKKGNLSDVKQWIAQGADINREDVTGFTALMYACWNGYSDVVVFLAENSEIDINKRSQHSGCTALYRAVANNHVPIVEHLLSKPSIDVNLPDRYAGKHWTPLHFASVKGYTQIVQLLLDQAKIDVTLLDAHGNNAEDLAKLHHHVLVQEALAEYNDTRPTGLTERQMTFLNALKRQDIPKIRSSILEQGLDVNTRFQRRRTPLHLASRYNWTSVLHYFLIHHPNEVHVNARDCRHWTPLHWASQQGHLEAIQALLDHRDTDIHALNDEGVTALYLATSNNHGNSNQSTNARNFLLDHGAGSHPEHPTQQFLSAVRTGDLGKLQAMDQQNMNVAKRVTSCNQKGQTSLHLACRHGHLNVIQWLLLKAAATSSFDEKRPQVLPAPKLTAIQDWCGRTALHEASRWRRNHHIVEYLVGRMALEDNFFICDKAGHTALHIALLSNNVEAAERLIQYIGDPNPYLFWAVENCVETGVLDLLMQHPNIEIQKPNNRGETILHCACAMGRLAAVELLMQHFHGHVNIHHKDCQGRTPLDRATEILDDRTSMKLWFCIKSWEYLQCHQQKMCSSPSPTQMPVIPPAKISHVAGPVPTAPFEDEHIPVHDLTPNVTSFTVPTPPLATRVVQVPEAEVYVNRQELEALQSHASELEARNSALETQNQHLLTRMEHLEQQMQILKKMVLSTKRDSNME